MAKQNADAGDETTGRLSDEEQAALKERARELKTAKRRGKPSAAEAEQELLTKIAELAGDDQEIAEGFHAVVRASGPELSPRLWYGMPAYARDGKVICFFQPAGKFKSRYATIGFNDDARLDDGAIWPTAFGVTEWNDSVAARVGELVRRALG
jgi:uncharacterized protein YdhG (YjbR/CyaY superfamily)